MSNSPQLSVPIKAQASQAEYEIRLVSYCVILEMPLIIMSNKVLGISGMLKAAFIIVYVNKKALVNSSSRINRMNHGGSCTWKSH